MIVALILQDKGIDEKAGSCNDEENGEHKADGFNGEGRKGLLQPEGSMQAYVAYRPPV